MPLEEISLYAMAGIVIMAIVVIIYRAATGKITFRSDRLKKLEEDNKKLLEENQRLHNWRKASMKDHD